MKEDLTRAARKAVNDLELPCEVVSVASLPDSINWRIQFTPGYGELSDSFQDETGHGYSDDKIIEIIKNHLLAMDEVRVRHSER